MKGEKLEPKENRLEKLLSDFGQLDDYGVASNAIISELFAVGDENVKREIEERMDTIDVSSIKSDAFFRLAKLYYETGMDLENALRLANKIPNADEQVRCRVHLASAVLKREKDIRKADKIVSGIKEDRQNYIKYYQDERRTFEKK